MESDEARSEVEGVGEEVADGDVFPLVVGNVVSLYVDLLVFWYSEAVDRVVEGGS